MMSKVIAMAYLTDLVSKMSVKSTRIKSEQMMEPDNSSAISSTLHEMWGDEQVRNLQKYHFVCQLQSCSVVYV